MLYQNDSTLIKPIETLALLIKGGIKPSRIFFKFSITWYPAIPCFIYKPRHFRTFFSIMEISRVISYSNAAIQNKLRKRVTGTGKSNHCPVNIYNENKSLRNTSNFI